MKHYYIVFFSLLFLNFFGATAINNTILLSIVIAFTGLEIRKKAMFKEYVILIFIGVFASMLSCYHFRGQSLFMTFRASAIFFYLGYYFMLRKLNFSIVSVEKAFEVLFIVYCVSYFVQYLVYPTIIFGGAKVEYVDDIRIRIDGSALGALGYFYGVNKFLTNKYNKAKYLVISLLCFVTIFLMGFRTMLAAIVLFSIVMLILVNGFSWKLLGYSLLIGVLFLGIIQIPVISDKIDFMVERQQEDNLGNEDYIRVINFLYYTQEHFTNVWEYFWGSGMAFPTTRYGEYMEDLNENHIWYVDWGLIGLSWIVGVIPVLVMIWYSVKSFFLKVLTPFRYLGVWFLYLLLISFTTAEFYRTGNFVIQALVLYLIERANYYTVAIKINAPVYKKNFGKLKNTSLIYNKH